MSDKEALKLADPFGAVIYLRKMAGYEEYLNHIEKNNPKQKEIILNDLEDLTELAKDYDDFATWFEAVNNMTEKKEADSDSSIQLLTIHASKGLEFDTVIIPDLNEGNIPSPHAAKEEDVEEERRLLYVAMTRAKHHLYLFAVENKTERIAPSRFLKDLHLKSQF